MSTFELVQSSLESIRRLSDFRPDFAIILGSGLGPLADEIEAVATVPYSQITGFYAATAPGHKGELVFGTLGGKKVVAMRGRIHLYEGITAAEVAFPVRVMQALGAHSLIVSNACGGLNPAYRAGSFMLQLDFINVTGQNALTGHNDERLGPRFPVMFDAYDPEYLEVARRVARAEDIPLSEGIYLAISGPAYATRAELRMFRNMGADTIGMSTVHEIAVARHGGMRVLGLSSVTDMALPDSGHHATGDEVIRVANESGALFRRLVRAILAALP